MSARSRMCFWILAASAPAVIALCLATGSAGFGFPDIASPSGRAILLLRLNRLHTGLVIGAALSVAGAVMQALLRNPLADPYVLGVSGGSALGAAAAILTGLAALHPLGLAGPAFMAGVAAMAIVYALASSRGRTSLYALLLSGVIVGAMASSLLMMLISLAPAKGLHNVTWWMLGNLQSDSPALLWTSTAIILLASAGAWTLARGLDVLTLGSEAAHYAGLRPEAITAAGLVLATLATATAVSLGGLIGFVGLLAPHAARLLVGPGHRRLIPAAALAGALFLALCDAVSRTLLAPMELPVGVVTAAFGGPFFLVLLKKRRSAGWVE